MRGLFLEGARWDAEAHALGGPPRARRARACVRACEQGRLGLPVHSGADRLAPPPVAPAAPPLACARAAESRPKELYTQLPPLWLRPRHNCARPPPGAAYDCPLYKTTARAGTLSTTGHSTNFVMAVELPTGGAAPDHWVERGAALFAALPF